MSFIQPADSYTASLRPDAVLSNSSQEMTWSLSLGVFEKRSVFVPFTLLGCKPLSAAIVRACSKEISRSAGMSIPSCPPLRLGGAQDRRTTETLLMSLDRKSTRLNSSH